MEPRIRTARTTAISTAAVAMRTTMFERRGAASGGSAGLASATSIGDLLRPRAKATDAALVRGDGLIEVRIGEIGPERLGAVELRVRRLPEQEIAESHFAGGADHQVRIGQAPAVEVTRQAGVLELGEVGALFSQLSDGVDDLLPAAVVDRDIENRFGADPGSLAGLPHLVLERRGKLVQPTGEAKLDAATGQLVDLASDGLREQVHQGIDFIAGPRPVLRREGIQRQDAYAAPIRGFRDAADGLDPSFVPHDPRQQAFTGPAAVAIHDDRDVLGRGQLAHQWFLGVRPP